MLILESLIKEIVNPTNPKIMSKKKLYSVVKQEDETITYKHTSELSKEDKVLHSTDDINEAIQLCNKENGNPNHGKVSEKESKDESKEESKDDESSKGSE